MKESVPGRTHEVCFKSYKSYKLTLPKYNIMFVNKIKFNSQVSMLGSSIDGHRTESYLSQKVLLLANVNTLQTVVVVSSNFCLGRTCY
jgi:hypothetical protein